MRNSNGAGSTLDSLIAIDFSLCIVYIVPLLFSIVLSHRYAFLAGKRCCSLDAFRMSYVGRRFTHVTLSAMETLHVVPQGTTAVHSLLLNAADSLTEGGKKDIFTPMFRMVLRKPM